jgi:hypothetical protein
VTRHAIGATIGFVQENPTRKIVLCLSIALAISQSAAAEGTTAGKPVDGGSPPPAASKAPRGPPKPPLDEGLAEVEISGTLKISEKPARLFVFVTRKACDPGLNEKDIVGSVRIDPFVGTNFFIEVFVPQGSKGNVCAAALDEKGRITAFGGYPKNPLTFRGEGEVSFGGVIFPLNRLPKPVPAPAKFKR